MDVIPLSSIGSYSSDGTFTPRYTPPRILLYPKILDELHSCYRLADWQKWRLVYEAGDRFVDQFLKTFSKRESVEDFEIRKQITPSAAFAKAAVNKIKNAIFQRTVDIARSGGPNSYQRAIRGEDGGVDNKGSTLNFYIGENVIGELLSISKIGIYVDNFSSISPDLTNKKHPYLCKYQAEDILNWGPGFVHLRHRQIIDQIEVVTRRHYYINANGFVQLDIYTEEKKFLKSQVLQLREIPFVIAEIKESLLKDAAGYQIALMNIGSADIQQLLKAGFPFYTEQRDNRTNNSYLKRPPSLPGEACVVEDDNDEEITTGVMHGRTYGKDLDRPGFIAPPMDPLKASMEKAEQLKDDMLMLVQLAVSNLASSADSKAMDLQDLEAGLSYIGLVLEAFERKIAYYWSLYTGENAAEVNYPRIYTIKSDEERLAEADVLTKIRDEIPSITFRKELSKKIATTVIGPTVTQEVLDKIKKEIDAAPYITSLAADIIADFEAGLVTGGTATIARGYSPDEYEKAKKDHTERLKMIQAAQTSQTNGVPDTVIDPKQSSRQKQGKPQRGPSNA